MIVKTSRFGTVNVESDDVLTFRQGLIGFSNYHNWVILADAENPSIAWLQSLDQKEIALAVVSPRRFVPTYQVKISERDLSELELSEPDSAFVLCVITRQSQQITINLRAPLIINLDRRLGGQVITCDDQPLQHDLLNLSAVARKSA
jgi:flagellar assembly factor FliW